MRKARPRNGRRVLFVDAKSGFTQGPVGFGVDALGLLSIKLDGGKGTRGTQLLPVGSDGSPVDDFGRLAVAGKNESEQNRGEGRRMDAGTADPAFRRWPLAATKPSRVAS